MEACAVRTAAMRYLSRREHSEFELTRKLARKGIDWEQARQAVAQLSQDNLVSNERFAQEFIRVRVQRGFGPSKIVSELKGRGIDSELINASLDCGDVQWAERCAQVAQRKFKDAPVETYKDWAKRARYLQGRGFTTEQISAALGSYRNAV